MKSNSFNETEQEYIEKLREFNAATSRMGIDDYETLKEELKESLHIRDSYNPFDEINDQLSDS